MQRSAIAASLCLMLAACNPNKSALDPSFHPTQRGWGSTAPVWSDEFDTLGTTLPRSDRWVIARFCGGHNGELQCYTDSLNNVSVSGHQLTITARQEACSGDPITVAEQNNEVAQSGCPGNGGMSANYSSARIHTRVLVPPGPYAWRYGRIEIRAKLPHGTGTWPAFWLLPEQSGSTFVPWPRSGEIDMMEATSLNSPNKLTDYVQANIHLCGNGDRPYLPDTSSATATAECMKTTPGPQYKQKESLPLKFDLLPVANCAWDLSKDFHTYALEWSDGSLGFFLDDQLIGGTLHGADSFSQAPFQKPFYLIINLAIGGAMGGTPVTGDWIDGSTTMPRAELAVDWVRVYACVPDPTARNCIYQGGGLGAKPPPVSSQIACAATTLPD